MTKVEKFPNYLFFDNGIINQKTESSVEILLNDKKQLYVILKDNRDVPKAMLYTAAIEMGKIEGVPV